MKGEFSVDLYTMVQMQRAGAFKVSPGSDANSAVIAGQSMTGPMCDFYAQKIGWTGRKALPAVELIGKTNNYIRAFGNQLTNPGFNNFDVCFENIRVTDSLKTFDRVVLTAPNGEQFTVIHGLAGLGGSYALFIKSVSQAQPVIASRSMRDICDYMNTQV